MKDEPCAEANVKRERRSSASSISKDSCVKRELKREVRMKSEVDDAMTTGGQWAPPKAVIKAMFPTVVAIDSDDE